MIAAAYGPVTTAILASAESARQSDAKTRPNCRADRAPAGRDAAGRRGRRPAGATTKTHRRTTWTPSPTRPPSSSRAACHRARASWPTRADPGGDPGSASRQAPSCAPRSAHCSPPSRTDAAEHPIQRRVARAWPDADLHFVDAGRQVASRRRVGQDMVSRQRRRVLSMKTITETGSAGRITFVRPSRQTALALIPAIVVVGFVVSVIWRIHSSRHPAGTATGSRAISHPDAAPGYYR